MKKFLVFLCAAVLILSVSGTALATLVTVDVYAGHSAIGGGAPY